MTDRLHPGRTLLRKSRQGRARCQDSMPHSHQLHRREISPKTQKASGMFGRPSSASLHRSEYSPSSQPSRPSIFPQYPCTSQRENEKLSIRARYPPSCHFLFPRKKPKSPETSDVRIETLGFFFGCAGMPSEGLFLLDTTLRIRYW